MEGWNGEGADQVPAVSSYGTGLLHFFLLGSFCFLSHGVWGVSKSMVIFIITYLLGIYPLYVE